MFKLKGVQIKMYINFQLQNNLKLLVILMKFVKMLTLNTYKNNCGHIYYFDIFLEY